MHLVELHLELDPAYDDATAKVALPELFGVFFCHAKVGTLVHVLGEYGLHLGEYVRVSERVLDESLPLHAALLVHALARLLEQVEQLLKLVQTVLDEHTKVVDLVEDVQFVLVDKVDGVEGLANVGQYVDDVGRTVNEVHALRLAVLEEFLG